MAESESRGGASAKYRPIAELGHGGMAQVYLALAQGPAGFNKLVVIKQIRDQLADDPEFLTMFLDEARLAARLNHPNVVQTNEVGGDGKRFYICMEYLEGQPLNRIMHRIGPSRGLTLGMQLRIVVDALAGLHYAHELVDFDGRRLEVVHRDATPHNIFVTYAGQVKVVDFGIAKALSSSSETRTGVLKGKVAYMAPEQAMGERVDRRADVFSVGMVLWEILAGKRLFKGLPDVAVLQRIIAGNVPSPRTEKPDVAPELEAICMKALAHDKNARFATAAEMAATLEQATDALGEKGTVRDAGRLIDQFFAGERVKIQKLVEEQAAAGRGAVDIATFDPRQSGSLPILDEHHTAQTANPGQGSASGSIPMGSARTPAPSLPTTTESPSTLTSASSASQVRPAADGRVRLIAAVLAALLGAVGAVAFFAVRGPAPAPQPSSSGEAAPKTHSILVDSTPQGATVKEGDKVLGTTPMTIEVDPAAPPRKLVMTLEGHSPHTFLPTRDVMVPLAPIPGAPQSYAGQPTSATADAAAPTDRPTKTYRPPPPAPGKPPPPPPSDINMSR
jgi:serine/threonine-protein kinase